jgi:Na+/H+-dicarboxylate symporter
VNECAVHVQSQCSLQTLANMYCYNKSTMGVYVRAAVVFALFLAVATAMAGSAVYLAASAEAEKKLTSKNTAGLIEKQVINQFKLRLSNGETPQLINVCLWFGYSKCRTPKNYRTLRRFGLKQECTCLSPWLHESESRPGYAACVRTELLITKGVRPSVRPL